MLTLCAAPVHAEQVQIFAGQCQGSSHIAEGAVGSDLRQRQSRFFCDTAVVTTGSVQTMIQFAEKGAHHAAPLTFAGAWAPGGAITNVAQVYFESGKLTGVDDGDCRYFRQGGRIAEIFCSGKVDEQGQRTVAMISFELAKPQ